ncbi:MAG: hypothetical protein JWR16_408 [Nevskia sp.]|nr:hypothetical protein [Nevskia sp.]
MSDTIVSATQLRQNPQDGSPHVVLLGAGASRASFPQGDANGRILPIMCDFVEVLDLAGSLRDAGIDPKENFEVVYSRLVSDRLAGDLLQKLERRINSYFSALTLPTTATHYDRLLLSLRSKDAIVTFNWDPFLFDAYRRNFEVTQGKLPGIYFLHGNVRIGCCPDHDEWGDRHAACTTCRNPYWDVPLLYPIEKKDYSTNHYIASAWREAKDSLGSALTLTIFGYGAPDSDADAVKLLRDGWFGRSNREAEHVEIIDTADRQMLYGRWESFTPTLHLHFESEFRNSRLWRWPRRSCESLFYPSIMGQPCEDFPLPNTSSLIELQQYCSEIARHEQP